MERRRDRGNHRIFCAAARDCPQCRGLTCKSDSALWRRRSTRTSGSLDFDLALVGAARKLSRVGGGTKPGEAVPGQVAALVGALRPFHIVGVSAQRSMLVVTLRLLRSLLLDLSGKDVGRVNGVI